MEYNFGKVDNYFNILSKEYSLNGEVDWKTFNSDQKKYSKHVVTVEQADFIHGTLRIREPVMIKLVENIYFNPNRPETWLDSEGVLTTEFSKAASIDPNRKLDWWPDFKKPENAQYFEPEVRHAYRLGFFAAMTIETNDVILNLNNMIMQQHPEHALQQRFFSVIELADQPFVPKQGPADFGKVLSAASNVAIINGKIGLSSHHAIHGNGINTVMVKNVDFIENEVCSIALNGCNDMHIVNVNVIKNRHDIPVLGSYSAGRFLRLFTTGLKDAISTDSESYQQAIVNLNKELDDTFNAVILKKGPVPELYKNPTGLIDGNYYGMIFNALGIAVNAPLKDRNTPKANESNSLYMKCVSINDIKTNINEILVLQREGKIMTAPSGAVFQFMIAHTNVDGKWYYKSNSLADLQIELVNLLNLNPHLKKYLGNFNLDQGLLEWKNNPESYFVHDNNKLVGKSGLEDYTYNVVGNGDSMFHVNKGTFGIRIDGLNTGLIDNLTISNVSTISKEGSLLAGNYRKSHPKQNQLEGYHGHHMYGINLNASNDVTLSNVSLKNITSKYGLSHGINVSGESVKIKVIDTIVDNVECSQIPFDETKSLFPNLPVNARGLFVNTKCDLGVKDLGLANIKDNPDCLNPSDCEFLSVIKTL